MIIESMTLGNVVWNQDPEIHSQGRQRLKFDTLLINNAGGPLPEVSLHRTIITSTSFTTILAWLHTLTFAHDKKCSYAIKYSQNEKRAFGKTEDDPGTFLV